MEHPSEDSMDDLEVDFAMDDSPVDDAPVKQRGGGSSKGDRQYQSRRRIEDLMERKRLKSQLGDDFADYDLPTDF